MVEELGIFEGMILYKVAPNVKILQSQPSSSTNPACGIIKRVKIINLSKGSTRKKPLFYVLGEGVRTNI
jgi:hypothetical protein